MTVKVEKVSYETALTLAGFGKFNYTLILLISSIITGMSFEIFSVALIVPASACELGTTSVQQGLMAGVPLCGIMVTSQVWGYLADTRGRRKILLLSSVLAFATGCIATFSPNWIVLSFLKLMSSSAVAGTFALALTLLSECTPEARRLMLIVSSTSIYLISTGSMAVISIPILPLEFSYYIPILDIHLNSWRLLNFIFTIPCAVAAIGLIWAYESPKYLLSIGEDEQALEVLMKINAINNGINVPYEVKAIYLDEEKGAAAKGLWNSIVSQTIPLLKPPLLKNTLLLAALFVTIYICMNPVTVWLPYMADSFMRSVEKGDVGLTFCEMLRSTQNTTISQPNDCSLNTFAMTMIFGINILLAGFNLIMTAIMKFMGKKTMLISIQLVAGVAVFCLAFSTNWILNSVLLIIFIFGILNFGILSAFSVDIFPTYVKAMAVCLTLMMGRGSAVLGINVLKNLLENDCELSFYILGSITLFGGLLGFLLPGETKKASQRKCAET